MDALGGRLKNSWMDQEDQNDWKLIRNNKEKIVEGYLGIGIRDGWKGEGGDPLIAYTFVRHMVKKFWDTNKKHLKEHSAQTYSKIFDRVVSSYSRFNQKKENSPRAYADLTIYGWKNHAISRICGSVGTKHGQNTPYFEVLVNSIQREGNDPVNFPFSISIFTNRKEAEGRAKNLVQAKPLEPEKAIPVVESKNLQSTDEFRKVYKRQHKKEVGPNSERLLRGLDKLETTMMKTQRVGNCWMKQPRRTVLALLFIETITQDQKKDINESFKDVKNFYKKWKSFTLSEVKSLLQTGGIHKDLITIANAKILKKQGKIRKD